MRGTHYTVFDAILNQDLVPLSHSKAQRAVGPPLIDIYVERWQRRGKSKVILGPLSHREIATYAQCSSTMDLSFARD